MSIRNDTKILNNPLLEAPDTKCLSNTENYPSVPNYPYITL